MTKLKVYVGTSGWIYEDWTGRFYPPEVKGAERLSYYAQQFNTVEVNATFYRFPTQAMIDPWNKRLGRTFHLVVKGHRGITHMKKLADCREQLQNFLDRVLELRRLKVILWQLPPSLHKDLARLEAFLSWLPAKVRHAVEFRHKSWWDQDTAELLSKYKAAFAAISHPRLPDTIYDTTDFLYLRFHGLGRVLYLYDYSRDELAQWAERVKEHLPRRTLYAFFNNDYLAYAVNNAVTLREMLA